MTIAPFAPTTLYLLTLDGVKSGFVPKVSGGSVVAPVISEAGGPDGFVHKHLGAPVCEDLVLEFGVNLAKPVYQWIADSWAHKTSAREVSIIQRTHAGDVIGETLYKDVFISEVQIPALDLGSKQAALFRVTLSAGSAEQKPAGGKADHTAESTSGKLFAGHSFHFKLDGIEPACAKVSRLDPFAVRQQVKRPEQERTHAGETTSIDFPSLKVALPESQAQPFKDWFKAMVIEGQEGKEKNGTLTLLSANLQSELASIKLTGVGIFRLSLDDRAHTGLRRMIAEMYCEQMEFVLQKAWA